MSEEQEVSVWKIVSGRGGAPVICDHRDNRVASIIETHDDEKTLRRAAIIAAAPDLYEATTLALQVFRLIAEHGDGDAALAARDMVPALESAVEWADFHGAITPETLIGP